jgi:hypothetical protein
MQYATFGLRVTVRVKASLCLFESSGRLAEVHTKTCLHRFRGMKKTRVQGIGSFLKDLLSRNDACKPTTKKQGKDRLLNKQGKIDYLPEADVNP